MTDKISKYEVVERIAEGGFGVVYKARDPYLKRTVAVKTCLFTDEESRQRFFREAQIAARFDHPNVTLVHDFGVEEDQAFLVQEYLSGEDLLQKIRRRDSIPLAMKLEYLLQAARGLRYAHTRGIIHRDIKPGNIRVLENEEVKILDFGIAKPVGGSPLTQQGMTVGTLGYLSPEQIEGKDLAKTTDIFSFGVVAYELIAYTSPFTGRDVTSMLRSILHDSPQRLEEIVPDCPSSVAEVVHRCLRRDPAQRYEDFEQLLQDLEKVARDLDSQQREQVTAATPTHSGVVQTDTKPIPVVESDEVEELPKNQPVQGATDSEAVVSETLDEAEAAIEPREKWSPPPPLEIPPRSSQAPADPQPPVAPQTPKTAAPRLAKQLDTPAKPPTSSNSSLPPAQNPGNPPSSGSASSKISPKNLGIAAGVLVALLIVFWILKPGSAPPPRDRRTGRNDSSTRGTASSCRSQGSYRSSGGDSVGRDPRYTGRKRDLSVDRWRARHHDTHVVRRSTWFL